MVSQLFWNAAYLVPENDIPEILRQCGDSQNVLFCFLVILGCNALVEGFRFVSNRTDVAGGK